MAKIPSPIHDDKAVPARVSKPTETAQAAATVAESAVAPAAGKPRASKSRAAAQPRTAKAAVAAKKKAAAPAKKAKAAPVARKAKAVPAAKKTKAAVSPAPAVAPPVLVKPAKAHKPKLVRDSFTIPKEEYQVLDALKSRALGLGQHVRKSELLRAGIQALNAMNDRALLKAVGAVPTLKTGRPKKG